MTKKIIQIIDDKGLTELKKGEIYEVKDVSGQYYCLKSEQFKNWQYIPVSQTKPVRYVKKDQYEVGDLVEVADYLKPWAGFSVAKVQEVKELNEVVTLQGLYFDKSYIKHAIVDDEVEIKPKPKKGHPHAALIMEYAKIAQEHEHPETWVECGVFNNGGWKRFRKGEVPRWNRKFKYRISEPPKPWPTIIINGIEVNAPIKDEPKDGTIAFPLNGYPEGVFWRGSYQTLLDALKSGFLFKSKEDALAAYNALSKPLTDCINLQK